MAAIITDFSAAVSASLYRNVDAIEGLGFALRVVNTPVMSGRQTLAAGIGLRHPHGNPVAEYHSIAVEKRAVFDQPPWEIENKQASSRCEDPNTLGQPRVRPSQVVVGAQLIVDPRPVLLAQVKRWVGKDHVDRS